MNGSSFEQRILQLGDERLATLNDLDVDPMWLRREFMKQEPPLADESRLRKV